MNKKIITLLLLMNFLVSANIAYCKPKKINNAPASSKISASASKSDENSNKTLKASVEDYRLDYINKDWWDNFSDPTLKGYILKAVTDNYDLKIATLHVQEARAVARESLGREFPALSIGPSYGRNKTSGTVSMGSFYMPSYTQSAYNFPLDVSYEIDLWGKNRDTTKSLNKELDAVKFDEKATYISLASSVASTYFNLISTDRQIELQEDIVKLREEIYKLTKANNENGLSPTTDVIQADRALTEAKSAMNDLKKNQSIFANELSILIGDSSDYSSTLKRGAIDRIEMVKNLPAAVKSDVVQARPDILSAEARLQESKINVRLAKKDFLPDITISGQFGFNSNIYEKAFNGDSYIAGLGLNLAEKVFSGGQRRARLRGKKYKYEEMLQNYQKTILTSFQEVNDSLASLKFDNQKNKDNIDRIRLEKDNFQVINNQYAYGELSYLETLQYKERILSLQREQVQSKTDCLVDTLSLYKAVGGRL